MVAWANAHPVHPVILDSNRLMMSRAKKYVESVSDETDADSLDVVAWSDGLKSKVSTPV